MTSVLQICFILLIFLLLVDIIQSFIHNKGTLVEDIKLLTMLMP